MNNEKHIFIYNDFEQSDLYWVIPTVYQLAKKKGIKKILTYRSVILSLKNDSYFKNKNIELGDVTNILPFYLKKEYKFIFVLINFINSILILNKLNFYVLNKKLNWTQSQFYHSILDTINVSRDKDFKISNIKKIKIILQCLYHFQIAKYLNSRVDFTYAFIGNSVYFSRLYLSVFRQNKTKVINQAQYNLHLQPKKVDTSWGEINNNLLKKLDKIVKKNKYTEYFKLRSKGKGFYADSKRSFTGKKVKVKSKIKNNYIFLHVFKDSPFNIIDRSRIFIDYFDWIEKTLNIIKDSKEKWFIKIHPSSTIWGENSKLFFKNLEIKNKNIVILNKKISNDFIFQKAKRIVTFSGTSYIEAISYGVKPIVISKGATISNFYKNIFKPKSIDEYKKLLSDNLNSDHFRQKNKFAENKAKKFIYIREKILTNFQDFGAYLIYKNISAKSKNDLKNKIKKRLYKKEKFFEFYAQNLLDYNHTISKKFREN